MNEEVCEIKCFDAQKVQQVQNDLLVRDTLATSQLFKVLSDERRVKILYALAVQETLCVCDLSIIIGATVAATSHHLRALGKLGILTHEKVGKMVYYKLENPLIRHLVTDVLILNKGEIGNGIVEENIHLQN
ncbi:MAG: metalloregulator ArsR/SmtB family transcription factor [Lactobacillales bacterium]|nr:metalloregulator ArsR/SmtB family transcription factor [Lactobacillales bacterium]